MYETDENLSPSDVKSPAVFINFPEERCTVQDGR